MPIKDDETRRKYFRDYMRRKRAGKKPKPARPDVNIKDRLIKPEGADFWPNPAGSRLKAAQEKIKRLEEKIAALQADDLDAALEKIRKLEEKNREHTNHIRVFRRELEKARLRKPQGFMEAETFRKISARLHPDCVQGQEAKRRASEAFQIFQDMKATLIRPKPS